MPLKGILRPGVSPKTGSNIREGGVGILRYAEAVQRAMASVALRKSSGPNQSAAVVVFGGGSRWDPPMQIWNLWILQAHLNRLLSIL